LERPKEQQIVFIFAINSRPGRILVCSQPGREFAAPNNLLQTDQNKVIATISTPKRCSTCMKIEQYSREAIQQGFPEELKNGKLEMRIINYENPENRHFMKDYKLVSKSLVLVNFVNGKQTKWTNLRLVWQLTGRKDAFLNYVRKEVRGYFQSVILQKAWMRIIDGEFVLNLSPVPWLPTLRQRRSWRGTWVSQEMLGSLLYSAGRMSPT
jgi:hypothetical protein